MLYSESEFEWNIAKQGMIKFPGNPRPAGHQLKLLDLGANLHEKLVADIHSENGNGEPDSAKAETILAELRI